MAQLIQCPECDKQLQVPEDLLGTQVQCPACRHTFTAALPVPTSYPGPARPAPPKPEPPPPRAEADRDDGDTYDLPIRKRSRSRSEPKPSKVQAIGVMSLIGGIFALLWALGMGAGSSGVCCLYPGTYYSFVLGILAIIRSSALLGNNAYFEKVPTSLAIMHMVNIINGDVTNLILGIIMLVFCNDDEVREYLAK